MSSFVNLQILGSGEQFPTTGKRTGKRFLSRVDSDVVNELVFSFEGEQVSAAILPVANILVIIQACDVFIVDVSYNVLHDGELLVAWFRLRERWLVDPHTCQDLIGRLAKVPTRVEKDNEFYK